MNTKLTIIILDYNKAKRVRKNIKNLLKQITNFNFEIVIIDNSCNVLNAQILQKTAKDYTKINSTVKKIEIIINSKNQGYPIPHNQVASLSSAEYLLVLNPDILCLDKNTLQVMIDYLDRNKDIAILGPKQINDDQKIAMTVRAFPHLYLQIARRTWLRYLPFLKNLVAYDEMKHLDYEKIQNVDWLQSSCMMIRKSFWNQVKGFNESYHLFMADTEICQKAHANNLKVVYFPLVTVQADGKRCSAGGFIDFWYKPILRQHFSDAIKYYCKKD